MTEPRIHGITDSRNHGTTEGQGESSIAPLFQSGAITSIAPLFQSGAIMTGDNPKLDIVNVDVHTKFDQILSICSRDIERKRN